MLDDHLEDIELRSFEDSLQDNLASSRTAKSTGRTVVGIDAANEDVVVVSHSHAPSQDSEWFGSLSPRRCDED